MPTIPHDRQITAQLAVSRPDQTFEDITDYLLSCSVELGDIDQVGTGNLGGDSTVRQFDFTLQNDREGVDGDSFHPLDKASEWNIQGGEWTPLLWPLREVVFRTAIQSEPEYTQESGTTQRIGEDIDIGEIEVFNESPNVTAVNIDVYDENLSQDENYVVGDENDVVGDENDNATALINMLFDTTANSKEVAQLETSNTPVVEQSERILAENMEIESDRYYKNYSNGQFKMWDYDTSTNFEIDYRYEDDNEGNTRYHPILPQSETVYLDGEETIDYTIDYDTGIITFDTSPDAVATIDYTYFRELFAGYLGDSIQSSEDGTTITCEARDYSKLIQDTYIDDVREYGDEDGNVLAEDVIQQILNDNMGADAPDLYTPISSNFAILPYELDYQSTWDGIQEVASQIGWFLGYLWDDDNLEWRLTFKPPPRDKEEGDYELTAKDDIYTADLDISDSDVRNVIEVEHRNEDEGDVQTAIVEDQDSIDEFRERRMTIGVQDAPHIDTLAEGERLAENILDDLKDLSSTTRANIPVFPFADLYTAFEVDDPRLTSESQFYAVETLRHDFRWGNNPQFRTEFTAGGRVIGSKHKWLRMETRPGAGQPVKTRSIPDRSAAGNTITVAASNSSNRGKKNADYVCNGSNDQVQINSAIDSLPSGGKVVLLEGTYIINNSINMKSDVTIEGQGGSTIVDGDNNTSENGFYIKEKSNTNIKNLKIKNQNSTGDKGIFIQDSGKIILENLIIENNYYGIYNNRVTKIQIKGCSINNNAWRGISATAGEGEIAIKDSIISNNIISDTGANGISLLYSQNTQISNNILSGNDVGIVLQDTKDGTIQNNNSENNNTGIRTIRCDNADIINNNIKNSNENGITLQSGDDNLLQGNEVRKNDSSPDYALFIYSGVNNLLVTNNDFKNSGDIAAIRNNGTDTSFGAGNRVNNGDWKVGEDYE